jgi:flagellar hook-associated protein 1 FlgK
MGSLSGLLAQTSSALNVFEQALSVVQNNVNNANTPGYASQRLNLVPLALEPNGGLDGGVTSQGLINTRDPYAEDSVQSATQLLGMYTAQAQTTGSLQSFFNVDGTSGLPAAITGLFQAFSAWSTTPTDATAQQNVISSAEGVASNMQQLSNSLSQTSQQVDSQIGCTVTAINNIAGEIQQYNVRKMGNSATDPAADAQLYSNLQSLSQLVNFTAVTQSDGTVSVMLSGGTPLVTGDTANPLSASDFVDSQPPPANPNSPPTAHILDSNGNDVTAQITSGQLGGLLDMRNHALASYLGDAQQQGSLNQLAQTLADTVNGILESGTVSTQEGAANGIALFTYSSADATDAAATLAVNAAITPAQLAPVDASGNANGNANALAALGSAASIDGASFTQFYGQMASNIGQENSTASANETTQTQVVSQATSLRDSVSGVSLNDQAAQVMEFQQAYQAGAEVLSVLNTLAQATLDIIQPTTA